MKAKFTPVLTALLLTGLVHAQEAAKPAPIDPETGFAVAPGFDLVKVYCTSCHSAKLVTQAGKTREGWVESIRWMQRTQGLFPLGDGEAQIFDYLASQYGIKAHAGGMLKLPALAANMMPPLPEKPPAKPKEP